MTTLLLSSRHTADDQALWRAAIARGWNVERARAIRVPEINDPDIVIYVEALFAPTIATTLKRRLLDPPEDWLPKLPVQYRQRAIELSTLGEARRVASPVFVKPPNDKSFAAAVYPSGAALPREFDDDMSVLIAQPVTWGNEYRCFMLGGKVMTASPYVRDGELARLTDYEAPERELQAAISFAEQVAADPECHVPTAIALDVGLLDGGDWAVIEANGAWGSGIYGCDPDKVLDVIAAATLPLPTNDQ